MEKRLTELVMMICSEKSLDKKLALIEEMKEALDEEADRVRKKHSEQST